MKGIRYILLILIMISVSSRHTIQGQAFEDLSTRERFFFGGNFWLTVGDITDIEISPLVGFRATERLSTGAGVKYEYYSSKFPVKFNTHIYGGRAFLNYSLIKDLNNVIPIGLRVSLFPHIEYEALSLERRFFDATFNDVGRYWLHSPLVGGGVGVPIGDRSGFSILILFNLNPAANNYYTNPIVRFGFNF